MPAFHREQIEAAVDGDGRARPSARSRVASRRRGGRLQWMRELAMRIAMRALLGLDPDDGEHGATAAYHFERALAFYGTDVPARVLRGPGSPWRRMTRSRDVLDEIVYSEIERRRARPGPEGAGRAGC